MISDTRMKAIKNLELAVKHLRREFDTLGGRGVELADAIDHVENAIDLLMGNAIESNSDDDDHT